MEIQKIQKLKNNKYKILIDGEILVIFDNVILDNNLLYKRNIDIDLYNKILEDNKYYDVYNSVLKYILKKIRSENEIRKYLLKFEIGNNGIEKIINKLKNNNLINDVNFCRAYINDNIYLSKNGINKIKNELINNNISIDVIDEELKKIDNEVFYNKLKKLVLKRINSNTKYSNKYLKQKILSEMIDLGYNKEEILLILDNNLINDDEIIKKEFNKTYLKLIKKYNSNELYVQIKNKLFQKGFSLEQINKLLEQKTEE